MARKALSALSKKRFYEIENMIVQKIDSPQLQNEILEGIKEIMNFDPNEKQYDPVKAAELRARIREQAALEGKLYYEVAGIKSAYLKRKEKRNCEDKNT
jgi:hypothetical protein